MSLRRACPFLGVVDSDCLRVEWDGHTWPVRLMDVDPERAAPGGAKPATEFGRRTLRWAKETYFKDVAEVGLEFPTGDIQLSNSGKLLCYVFVRGENYNVRLVREGWSPCFPKYGHPQLYRAELEDAEFWARLEGRGVWGGHGGRGDYHVLKFYWQLRAGQVACYRQATALGEDILSCRLDYADLVSRSKAEARLVVFGDLRSAFHLPDGSVQMQVGNPRQPLTALFPAAAAALAGFVEREFIGFGKPNYVFLDGVFRLVNEHPQIVVEQPEQIHTYPPEMVQ